MSEAGEIITGGCLCGAVSFAGALRKGRVLDACHCSMCRRWSGSPFLGVELSSFKVNDGSVVNRYRSSDWAERWSCKRCGSALVYKFLPGDWFTVGYGFLDDQTGYEFTTEIYIDEKPDAYAFANDTCKMTGAEVIAAFSEDQESGSDG